MTTGNDRRRFARIPIDFSAELVINGKKVASRVIDLSLKGALVERPADLEVDPGNDIDLVVHEDSDIYQIGMKTKLHHSDEHHLGLECVEIDIDSITHLRRLVELNLGDSELLNREFAELCNH